MAGNDVASAACFLLFHVLLEAQHVHERDVDYCEEHDLGHARGVAHGPVGPPGDHRPVGEIELAEPYYNYYNYYNYYYDYYYYFYYYFYYYNYYCLVRSST